MEVPLLAAAGSGIEKRRPRRPRHTDRQLAGHGTREPLDPHGTSVLHARDQPVLEEDRSARCGPVVDPRSSSSGTASPTRFWYEGSVEGTPPQSRGEPRAVGTCEVAMVIQRYAPVVGGGELQLERLLPHLGERGVHARVLTHRGSGSTFARVRRRHRGPQVARFRRDRNRVDRVRGDGSRGCGSPAADNGCGACAWCPVASHGRARGFVPRDRRRRDAARRGPTRRPAPAPRQTCGPAPASAPRRVARTLSP